MNQHLFETLLDALQPTTLAAMLLDLAEAADDWQHYPEDAPSAADRRALAELQAAIEQLARRRAAAESLDFDDLLARLRAGRDDSGWLDDRNQQTRDNWFSDYD